VRLALVRQRYNPFGGAERFIERAISALERGGTEVTVITRAWGTDGGRRALIVDPPYVGRLWRDVSFSRGVRALLGREKFDLVQSHERIPGCDVYRAGDGVHRQWLAHRAKDAALAERIGIRLNPYHWYTCAAERVMFEHPGLRAVICNSEMVAAEIRRHFRISSDKLHVIYNGVDLDHFHPDRRNLLRVQARAEFGCKEGDKVFCFVGSGFARKGLAAAIDALAASGREDFRLVVAGRDRAESGFRARAAAAGVAGRVVFLGGREDVRPVYAAADCFILPTRYDPFPNAALEALAMGVPVIVSSQCGAAEVVEPGVNGWVCAPGEADPISGLMLEAAKAAGPGMSGAARRTAEGYGIEGMADRMTRLYELL
ncbi:unnamed protein product, partial [Phaeothamnion confervicola]